MPPSFAIIIIVPQNLSKNNDRFYILLSFLCLKFRKWKRKWNFLFREIITSQYHCMSSWAKSKFCWANSDTKPRSDSDEGISERIWATFYRKCYIPSTSHQKSLRDPANRKRFALLPRSSLGKSSTSLRMTYRNFIGLLSKKAGEEWIAPAKQKNAPHKAGRWVFISILPSILFSLARGALPLLCQNGLLWHPCFWCDR